MKLKTNKYKSVLSISILTSLGFGAMMINSYENIESNENEYATMQIEQINAGRHYSSLTDSSGNLWMWGNQRTGQLGDGVSGVDTSTDPNTDLHSSNPINITAQEGHPFQGKTVEKSSFGFFHSGAIDSDGELWMWGHNGFGQLGMADPTAPVINPTPINITHQFGFTEDETILELAIGGSHSAAIDSSGDLWMWGNNASGQLGNGQDGADESLAAPINITQQVGNPIYDVEIAKIQLGYNFSGAIDVNGNLWMWGHNDNGQLGNEASGTDVISNVPINITAQTGIELEGATMSEISFGYQISAAIDTNDDFWIWGGGIADVVPDNMTESGSSTTIEGETIVQLSTGYNHVAAIDSDNDLWLWGNNAYGQLGNKSTTNSSDPINLTEGVETDPLYEKNITQVSLGGWHSLALTDEGEIYSWGLNEYGQLGNGDSGLDTSGNKKYVDEPYKLTDEFLFLYESSASDITSTTATLNYTLELGNYLPENITVEYRNNGGEWITHETTVLEGNNTIEVGNLTPGVSQNFEIKVMVNEDSVEKTLNWTLIEFTTDKNQPILSVTPDASNVTSSDATLNYDLNLVDYLIDEVTVQYRHSGGEWITHDEAGEGSNQINLTDLEREKNYVYEMQIAYVHNGVDLVEKFQFNPFTTGYSLNTTETIGIVAGVIAALALIGVVVLYILKKKNKMNSSDSSSKKKLQS